ncbi:MAG TPA: c-type cytochrome [Candidatus Limnocylindrales bacterium]|nr:c-type cytochrome [Candidatus Limnocylindrales bacterium]
MNSIFAPRFCRIAVLLTAPFLASSFITPAQQPPAPKTASQQFKNIQVLKDIPADQLIPTMQFIAGALGVDCEFCHLEHDKDKDDKKEKLTARKMIEMELVINKAHFKNEIEVTCYTCHRGSPHPIGIPILVNNASAVPGHERHEISAQESMPTAEQVLDKYLAAVGGAEALHKIRSRVQKGTVDTGGEKYPIEIYSEGPEKRLSISHASFGESVTAFNGQAGWLATPRGVHPMNASERQSARIDAQIHFPARIRELYQDFKVLPGEAIDGRATFLVTAAGLSTPPLRLFFDQQTGLLLRLVRYTETPLGRNPAEVDYTDYRDAGGVKIPFQWTLTRTNGSFTIRIASVQQNVPIDEKLFVMPPIPEAPHP